MSTPEQAKDPQAEAEFTRKMVLGILSLLESKGVLSQAEVNSILRAARQAAYPMPEPKRPGPALPGTPWVRPAGAEPPLDRPTTIAIPNVLRARDLDSGAHPSVAASADRSVPASVPLQPAPTPAAPPQAAPAQPTPRRNSEADEPGAPPLIDISLD